MRWEYAVLTFVANGSKGPDDVWTWKHKATFGQRAMTVARWTTETPVGDLPIGESVVWTADGANPEELSFTSGGPLDLLGDLGWEVVTTVIERSVSMQNDTPGWNAMQSVPFDRSYTLKRPA